MSYSTNRPNPRIGTAEIPRGEVIARYGSYTEAQKAVDHLSDQQFEVSKISIIGSDLKSVEQVTGRLSYPKVALQGALNGVMFGAFFGLLMSVLGGTDLASSLLLPIIMGGAFWMLLATIGYATQRGKRDFTSTNRIVAGSYEVIAAPEVAGQARHVLGDLSSNGPRGPVPPGRPGAPRPAPPYRQGPGGPYPPAGQYPHQAPPPGAYPPVAQQPPAPQGQPEYGIRRPEAPAQQDPGRSAQFPDLPDGRPQYGIRTGEQDPQARPVPENTGFRDPAAGQEPPGTPQGHQGSSPAAAPWSRPDEQRPAGRGREHRREGEDRER